MKRMIRKDPVGMFLLYSDGTYSRQLKGAEVELDQTQDSARLIIDFQQNLKEIDKDDFWCSDAAIFLDQPALLASVRIDQAEVDLELFSTHRKHPYLKWTLELRFNSKGIFIYGILPAPVHFKMTFKIARFITSYWPLEGGGREIA